jgi:DNA-directed RNA polymerase subunit RPC12/RpoP
MNIQNFFKKFPDQANCKAHFKAERDKQGVICKRCGHQQHYWLSTRDQYQCKSCKFRTTLRSGTLLQGSQLPYYYWYFAMMLLSGTKKSFSALEVQRQLGHPYYEPIWYMLHKIRYAMGKRDDKYLLNNEIELDEGFFEIVPNKKDRDRIAMELQENDGKYKRGKGSQKQAAVLVMVESKPVEPSEKYKNKAAKKPGYIKMKSLDDLGKETTDEQVAKSVESESSVTTDGANNYNDLSKNLADHKAGVAQLKKEASKILPWVHIAISNAKRLLLDVHHSIGNDYLQRYPDEFCYKFNRRYFDSVFERMIFASVSCKWEKNMQNIG